MGRGPLASRWGGGGEWDGGVYGVNEFVRLSVVILFQEVVNALGSCKIKGLLFWGSSCVAW